MSLADFAALNERRGGRADVHEPAQLRREARFASSIKPMLGGGRSGRMVLSGGRRAGTRVSEHSQALDWLGEHRFRVNPDIQVLDSED